MRPGGLLHPDHAVQESVGVLHSFRVLLVNMRPRNFRLILTNMRPDAGRRPGLGIKVRLHGQHHRRCDTIWNNAQSHTLGRCSKLSGKQLLLGWITITLRWIRERSQIMWSWGGRGVGKIKIYHTVNRLRSLLSSRSFGLFMSFGSFWSFGSLGSLWSFGSFRSLRSFGVFGSSDSALRLTHWHTTLGVTGLLCRQKK